jgi:hypothetical protein
MIHNNTAVYYLGLKNGISRNPFLQNSSRGENMRKIFIRLFDKYIDTKHLFITWIILFLSWLFFRVYFPETFSASALVRILDQVAVISIFLSMLLFGINVIKNKEGPLLFYTIKGTAAIIAGAIFSILNLIIIVWYLKELITNHL